MFDFRYHLVSLAAVFIALAVGILLGAAISGKLGDAEDALMKDRLASLNDQLTQERSRSDIVERRSQAAQELLADAYPALMENRLEGKSYGVLFLGPVDGTVRSAVERTLSDSGGGSPVRLVALDTPVNPDELDSTLQNDEQLARYAAGGDDFGDLGEALGRDLVQGEGTPLWSSLSSRLIEERSGTTSGAVDGIIVIKNWKEPETTGDAQQQSETNATNTLFEGLVRGLESTGLPVVGVEPSSADSDVALFRQQGVSSVDDVDTVAGRLALALLLAGGEPGHYGVKDSATDGVVPQIEPVPTATTGG
jgi:copper transport outer membrane protein MctB